MRHIYVIYRKYCTPVVHYSAVESSYTDLKEAKNHINALLDKDIEWIMQNTDKSIVHIEEITREPGRTIVKDGDYFCENRIESSILYE